MEYKDLTEDQRAKAAACSTPEELLAFAKGEEFELSDEQLESVVGGVSGGWAPEGYDPSGMWKDLPTSGTN